MFFGLIWPCLHLVVNPLYLLSWSLLLNVDFDSATATSRKVFFSWLILWKGFSFPWRGFSNHPPLLSSMDIQAFFMLLSSVVCSFFLRMYQTDDLASPKVPAISNGFGLFLKPNNYLFHFIWILWLHDVGSQQQLPNANGILRINSRP